MATIILMIMKSTFIFIFDCFCFGLVYFGLVNLAEHFGGGGGSYRFGKWLYLSKPISAWSDTEAVPGDVMLLDRFSSSFVFIVFNYFFLETNKNLWTFSLTWGWPFSRHMNYLIPIFRYSQRFRYLLFSYWNYHCR